ncbi:hypothetical protein [Robertmurraya kyonggiensis]|uniref:Uncharacterized protein n=1 Tax=Robertmurraya kyonggiensis TaxID=1037680 RepID=A0A4U1D4R8_9BACI|nr:hypothetical protein [Robertmurraya kyonggiensis]TKC16116.1 hypothetical protein FA727_14255 [Robertmurraya kyonggiensis]
MKRALLSILFICTLVGCGTNDSELPTNNQAEETEKDEIVQPNEHEDQHEEVEDEKNPNEYENTEYGFVFSLPESWKGYRIVEERWEGLGITEEQSGKVVETGPQIVIRHPQWTEETPRQDIPIMIFTLEHWEALQKEEYSVGAAPIKPKELGRNDEYVFALPARYNFAFPLGFEEVEEILNGNPLKPIK